MNKIPHKQLFETLKLQALWICSENELRIRERIVKDEVEFWIKRSKTYELFFNYSNKYFKPILDSITMLRPVTEPMLSDFIAGWAMYKFVLVPDMLTEHQIDEISKLLKPTASVLKKFYSTDGWTEYIVNRIIPESRTYNLLFMQGSENARDALLTFIKDRNYRPFTREQIIEIELEYAYEQKTINERFSTRNSTISNQNNVISNLNTGKASSQRPTFESASNNESIEMKPNINSGKIDGVFDVLKDYFDKKEHEELRTVLKTGNDNNTKLLFKDKAIRFTDVFKQLYEHNLITGCEKQHLINWILNNFKYLKNGEATDFNPDTTEKSISGNQYICKTPLIKIENGEILKITESRKKKYSNY